MVAKSQDMLELESEIASARATLDILKEKRDNISGFKPVTKDGKTAQQQALEELVGPINTVCDTVASLVSKLEVTTVAHLMSNDSLEER